jgi:hypothetical protein
MLPAPTDQLRLPTPRPATEAITRTEHRLGYPDPAVNLEEVRQLPARDLEAALDHLGIEFGWEHGDHIRQASLHRPRGPCLPEPAKSRVEAFRNLVVGTIAERAFWSQHLAVLPKAFAIVDLHERGEGRDFAVRQGTLELPINVKVASTQFREARRIVHLDPDDCIPIGAYKAIGASERIPDLVYVFLVDFTLRAKVDDFMDQLTGPVAIGWHLLSWYMGKGVRKAQDRFIEALFAENAAALMELVPGVTSYHVISAQRALAIMHKLPRRVPGLGVKAAGRGVIRAEVNIHVSVGDETRPWSNIVAQLSRDGIQTVLDQIRQTTPSVIPDPGL